MKLFHFTWSDVTGETEYRLLESFDGVAPLSVVATIGANSTSYDLTVPLFRRINAQYVLRACNASTCSDSQQVAVTGTLAASVGYVKASNVAQGDSFGISIALSADGSTLAVGATEEDSNTVLVGGNQADDSAPGSGAVYVFSRSGATWFQQAYVKASNTGAGDHFGSALALSSDGNTLAVAAVTEASNATGVGGNQADNSKVGSGAVYVFLRSGASWSQQAYIKASNTEAGAGFGWSVALAADGNTLVVGSSKEASSATGIGGQVDNLAPDSGAVYVFTRSGSSWSQQAYVKASNTGSFDRFGSSVALSADGNTLAVGAWGEASNATGVGGDQSDNNFAQSGAVYVFSRNGIVWSQQAYVKASNTQPADLFGWSVSLSANGAVLAVGAPYEDSSATGVGGIQGDNSASESGAVYVFARGGSTWSQQAYLKASNTGAGDTFGWSVCLSADGQRLAIGASGEDGSGTGLSAQNDNAAADSGAVYFFSVTGVWAQSAYVKAPNSEPGDYFGTAVALSADATTLAVGAPEEDSKSSSQNDNSGMNAGAVYLY